jgi:hypothetical protein
VLEVFVSFPCTEMPDNGTITVSWNDVCLHELRRAVSTERAKHNLGQVLRDRARRLVVSKEAHLGYRGLVSYLFLNESLCRCNSTSYTDFLDDRNST